MLPAARAFLDRWWSRETSMEVGRELIFFLPVLYAAWPVWTVEHPPIQDLPQHLAAVRVLADYNDPGLNFSHYFTVDLSRTQYLAYYLAAISLSWAFGVLVANKVLITASIIATPYAMRFLLRALGRQPWLAWAVLPLTWNAHLILGFMNFCAAIPLALLGLALAVRLRQQWRTRTAVGLGVVALVCFYTHVVPFAFLGLGAALLGTRGGWRATLLRWVPLAPASVAMFVWSGASPAGQSTVGAVSGQGPRIATVSVPVAIGEIPQWLTDVLHTETDSLLLAIFVLLLLFAATTGVLHRRRSGGLPLDRRALLALGLLSPLAGALYFLTPASYDWIWPINARFPLLALVFAVPLLPAQRGPLGAFVLIAFAAVSVASTREVQNAFERFERDEVGQLEEAIAVIDPGARTAGLIYDRGSENVKFSPFIHSVAWVQARRGGAVMFTFADFPQSPFAFREHRRPPRVGPRWEWMPAQVHPARDLPWYDFVLVRGGPGRIGRMPEYELIFESARWRVYRNNR